LRFYCNMLHCIYRKEPTKSSGAGLTNEIHKLTELGHNPEELHKFETRHLQRLHESEISTTPCPAYVHISHQGSGRVEEPVYESI